MKKKSSMKQTIMKKKKSATKVKSMKETKPRVSIIAFGKGARRRVFTGKKEKTTGGLKRSDLIRSRKGRIVSKRAHFSGKKLYYRNGISKWVQAIQEARKVLKLKGFVPIGGNTPQGKAFIAKIRSFYKK